jgi:hypothetical protein
MVVGVETNVLQVVVFAASSDAFLRVGGAGRGVGARCGTEEYRYKLVHPRVRKEEVRGIGKEARGGYDRVFLAKKKIEERAADLCGSHGKKGTIESGWILEVRGK